MMVDPVAIGAARMPLERWHRGQLLCRVSFGLTCYLENAPSADEVMRAYATYRAVCPLERRSLITTVRRSLFLPMGTDDISAVAEKLKDQDRRRDEGIVVWDGQESSQWMFWMQGYVEPVPSRPVASFCQILVPEDSHPDVLHTLAGAIADEIPILSGHAGYTVQFNASLKQRAFNQSYAWAKRYLGLEVEDLNVTLPYVLDAIKSANWLTLVGSPLEERLKTTEHETLGLPPEVVAESRRFARLYRAGAAPMLADRNREQFPHSYAAVERLVAPIKVQEHGEFAGRFAEENATGSWLRRLIEEGIW